MTTERNSNSKKHRNSSENQSPHQVELQGSKATDVELEAENYEEPIQSNLSSEPAVRAAQLLDLTGSEGSIVFYSKARDFDVGDVIFLREKVFSQNGLPPTDPETGLIAQIISKGIASYPQADKKALLKIITTAHARERKRSYNEPKKVIDEFLVAEFMVRASIQKGEWKEPEGKVVTRNVDIFPISPEFLTKHIIKSYPELNLFLGDYKKSPIKVDASGFEKVNLITGMKGGGKSHITKGIIHLQTKLGMPSIVFDINGEYFSLPKAKRLRPTEDFKFRLDQLPVPSIFKVFEQLSLFNTTATENAVRAQLPEIIKDRKDQGKLIDLKYLLTNTEQVIKDEEGLAKNTAILTMRGAYKRGISNLNSYNLFCTEDEAQEEEKVLKEKRHPTFCETTKKQIEEKQLAKQEQHEPKKGVVSLRTVLYRMAYSFEEEDLPQSSNSNLPQSLNDLKNNAEIIVFDIGGLAPTIQKVVVTLVIDQFKSICDKQYQAFNSQRVQIPIYPSIFFEEAHMYMDAVYIDELIPLIRHLGMNLFFVTSTPGALPDSVFRLLDNLIMARMVNQKDIDKVVDCGLADKKTIEGFAKDLPKYHNLFLSAMNGATKNFPLVFQVRDFTTPEKDGGEGLPKSGVTRSMWEIIKQKVKNAES